MNKKVDILEKGIENAVWRISRYANEEDRKAKKVYSKEESLKLFGAEQFTQFERNCLLNEGINELWTLVAGSGATLFNNANAYLGVGSDSTAASAAQTGLIGDLPCYKGMEASYPTYGTSQKATWKASFGADDANFDWEEFTVCNTDSNSGKNLCRKVSSQGTKAQGQTWELTLDITLS